VSAPDEPAQPANDEPDPQTVRDAQEQAAATERHRARHWKRDTPS